MNIEIKMLTLGSCPRFGQAGVTCDMTQMRHFLVKIQQLNNTPSYVLPITALVILGW